MIVKLILILVLLPPVLETRGGGVGGQTTGTRRSEPDGSRVGVEQLTPNQYRNNFGLTRSNLQNLTKILPKQ